MTRNVNTLCHDLHMDKKDQILTAAQQVFSRYGYARTTMGDVAEAAGFSRPALYLLFPGKEELFSAVIRRMNADAFQDVQAGLAACGTLEEKLQFALDRWMAQAYDVAFASPDAEDLFRYSHPAMQEVSAEFQAFLADLLRNAASAAPLNATPEDLARALFFSVHGFKTAAANGTDLRRMIALQVRVVVEALGQ